MDSTTVKAIVIRALKTFVQGFLAVFATSFVTVVDQATLKAALVGAFAAGISALMNIAIQPQEAK